MKRKYTEPEIYIYYINDNILQGSKEDPVPGENELPIDADTMYTSKLN